MPSGKTHDAITFLFVAPVFAASWSITRNVALSATVTFTFLFGGLMFGPDLDTMSKQYTRWSFFRFLWYPYQAFFKHRSRWSHGLIFGTFLRVVYFIGVLTIVSFITAYILAIYTGGDLPRLVEFTKTWQQIGDFVRLNLGEYAFISIFAGLWLGAASHTLTDMAGSFVKTGRVTEFL
ncbi:MAG: metal-binding protein [Pyrinomonadaceae bacterium]